MISKVTTDLLRLPPCLGTYAARVFGSAVSSSLLRTAAQPAGDPCPHAAAKTGLAAPTKPVSKGLTPMSVPFLSALVLLTMLLTLACTDPEDSETTSESVAPVAEVQPTLQPEIVDGATPTNTSEPTGTATPAPVILGDCEDGMRLQPGEGCYYAGGGSSQPRVLLSASWDGAICREGGPIQRLVLGAQVNVDNFRLCTNGFEKDDSFDSDIEVRKNTDGSWTINKPQFSAPEATPSGAQVTQEPPQNVFKSGEEIPDFPTDRAFAGSFRDGVEVLIQGGNAVIQMADGGTAEYSHATYTCLAAGGCLIENGRVTSGSVRVTGTTDTSSAPTSTPIPMGSSTSTSMPALRLTDNDDQELDPVWSPDGQRIAFYSDRDGNHEIYVMDADGSNVTRLTDNNYDDRSPVWSPDGQRIAFYIYRLGKSDIYVMDADGFNVTPLTDNDSSDIAPAWSPDGQRIAFGFHDIRDWNIYVMDADGSNVTRLTDSRSDENDRPAWSPDGNRIAFAAGRFGDVFGWDYEIYVMDADGSNVMRLTDNDGQEFDPAWSPDGQRIAFASDRDGDRDIYVMDADGSNVTRLTDNDSDDGGPAWSPDGQRIAFYSELDGDRDIYVMDVDGLPVSTRTPIPTATPTQSIDDGTCRVGLVVRPGESCVYPGASQEFSVDSSGSGHFLFFTAGTGISARNTTINGVQYNFAASKQADGSWIIEAAGAQ